MTALELANALNPGHVTVTDGLIYMGNVLSETAEFCLEPDAVITGPTRDGLALTWTATDNSGSWLITETGNGDVVVEAAS